MTHHMSPDGAIFLFVAYVAAFYAVRITQQSHRWIPAAFIMAAVLTVEAVAWLLGWAA